MPPDSSLFPPIQGMISVAFLWLMMITCFPAYCYLDIKRQNAGRCDVLFCMKKREQQTNVDAGDGNRGMSGYVYDVSAFVTKEWFEQHQFSLEPASLRWNRQFVYKPLVIKDGIVRLLFFAFVVLASLALLGVSIWGLVSRTTIGLGLEDFFPDSHQASVWAHESADHLASWPITMNWGKKYNSGCVHVPLSVASKQAVSIQFYNQAHLTTAIRAFS